MPQSDNYTRYGEVPKIEHHKKWFVLRNIACVKVQAFRKTHPPMRTSTIFRVSRFGRDSGRRLLSVLEPGVARAPVPELAPGIGVAAPAVSRNFHKKRAPINRDRLRHDAVMKLRPKNVGRRRWRSGDSGTRVLSVRPEICYASSVCLLCEDNAGSTQGTCRIKFFFGGV